VSRSPRSKPRPPLAAARPHRPGRPARPALRFAVTFAAAAIVLFGVYQMTEVTHTFRAVNELNATLCVQLLRLCRIPVERSGTTMLLASGGMDVVSECSAVYVLILFAAAVMAFPTTWRARGRGLLIGLPCLFVVNLLRLVSLGVVIRFRASLLPLFHEYLWQVLFIFVVAGLYLFWIERIVPRAATRPAA
jgi:exosortase/archaeosortase family protein